MENLNLICYNIIIISSQNVTIRWSPLSATAQDAIGTGGFVMLLNGLRLQRRAIYLRTVTLKICQIFVINPTLFGIGLDNETKHNNFSDTPAYINNKLD